MDARATARCLSALIKKHERISIAVAWGGMMPTADMLLANKTKFAAIVVGVHFCATDPELIDRLVDVPNAFVAKYPHGCFHPKIYYFESGTKAEAIVGSANFTRGGLGVNLESGVHVKGAANDPFFVQVRDQLKLYRPWRQPITEKIADSYRRQHGAASKIPRPKDPLLPGDGNDWTSINAPLAIMSWKDFSKLARKDEHHNYNRRMELLRAIQKFFSKSLSFARLPVAEAKAVAGVLGYEEAERAGLDHLDCGLFGSMGGAGTFANLIGSQNKILAAALDAIPKRGDVSKAQFDDYVATFTAAFSDSSRIGRLPPATRLLAMKRPDFFVCVNDGNKARLATALSFAPTTIKLENYWERVISPIQQAPWYNAPRPMGPARELWDARVAMLDAIYYRP